MLSRTVRLRRLPGFLPRHAEASDDVAFLEHDAHQVFRRGELDDTTQVGFSVFRADDAGARVEEFGAEPVSERW